MAKYSPASPARCRGVGYRKLGGFTSYAYEVRRVEDQLCRSVYLLCSKIAKIHALDQIELDGMKPEGYRRAKAAGNLIEGEVKAILELGFYLFDAIQCLLRNS